MTKERLIVLDLPGLDAVCVDMDKPLESQLPPGSTLNAARKMIEEMKKTEHDAH